MKLLLAQFNKLFKISIFRQTFRVFKQEMPSLSDILTPIVLYRDQVASTKMEPESTSVTTGINEYQIDDTITTTENNPNNMVVGLLIGVIILLIIIIILSAGFWFHNKKRKLHLKMKYNMQATCNKSMNVHVQRSGGFERFQRKFFEKSASKPSNFQKLFKTSAKDQHLQELKTASTTASYSPYINQIQLGSDHLSQPTSSHFTEYRNNKFESDSSPDGSSDFTEESSGKENRLNGGKKRNASKYKTNNSTFVD